MTLLRLLSRPISPGADYLQQFPIDLSEQNTGNNATCYRGFDLHATLERYAIMLALLIGWWPAKKR